PSFRKLLMAVPAFIPQKADGKLKELGQNAAKELGGMLIFSGLFNIMSESAYDTLLQGLLSDTKKRSQFFSDELTGLQGIDVLQWKALGVESLTLGQIDQESSGYVLTIRTVDINRGEVLLGKRYRKVKQEEITAVLR